MTNHKLPPLPYDYDALEPHIDAKTIKLHHDVHHLGYVNGLNEAEVKLAEARSSDDYSLVKHWERELAFHGAGHFLHSLYWENMSPTAGGSPGGPLAEAVDRRFGSFEAFLKHFKAAGAAVEGSGWVLLVQQQRGTLEILTAEKHQNLSQWMVNPLLACDLWEHAYYLKYQNRRNEYLEAFTKVIHWEDVERRYLGKR